MNKKIYVSIAIILFTIFSFTVCFANDNGFVNAANNVRNFVGGVEDTVENAALDVSNTSKNVTGGIENGVNNDTMNGRYNTSRTSTEGTLMGMSSNGWTWLILGIAAIAIIAVVWYYSMQFTNKNNNNDND